MPSLISHVDTSVTKGRMLALLLHPEDPLTQLKSNVGPVFARGATVASSFEEIIQDQRMY